MGATLSSLSSSDEYKILMGRRRRLIWPLLAVTVAVYMAFILMIAFFPAALGMKVGDSALSLGILLGLGLILFNFLITLFYVRRANRDIEPLIAKVHAVMGEPS